MSTDAGNRALRRRQLSPCRRQVEYLAIHILTRQFTRPLFLRLFPRRAVLGTAKLLDKQARSAVFVDTTGRTSRYRVRRIIFRRPRRRRRSAVDGLVSSRDE